MRALDGLRGIAVLAVVVYHFAPGVAPGGFLGVDLFFVLSGFLITSLLVNEWAGASRISLRSFWLRRARRLLPALFLVLTVVGVYELLFASRVEAQHVGSDGLWSVVYLANWHVIATGQSYIQQFVVTTPSPLRHMWSLAIEEQFYLVWPLIVAVVGMIAARGRARTSRRYRFFRFMLATVCVVLGVVSFVRMLTVFQPGADPSRVYYGTDTRAFIVLVGAFLGAWSAGAPTVRREWRGIVNAAGTLAAIGLGVAVMVITPDSSWIYEGGYGVIALLMLVMLAAAAQPGRNPLAAVLKLRPVVGLGLISYGVYLWHWPIGLWFNESRTGLTGPALFVLRCALTLGVSLASYFLLEMPIRRGALQRLQLTRHKGLAFGFLVAFLLLLAIPAFTFPTVALAPTDVSLARSATEVTASYAAAPQCDGVPAQPIASGRLLRVQLEGNSIAGEVRPCLSKILAARGVALQGVNAPGFLLCQEVPAIKRRVQNPKTHLDAVILFTFVANGGHCDRPWEETVDRLIKIWKAAGIHVFLAASVPYVPGTQPADAVAKGLVDDAAHYQKLAAADPEHITTIDAGAYIRDGAGNYVWRMPCLPGGEPGCDAQHTVGVRWPDGFHYCTAPDFAANGCVGTEHQGGERRVSSAIAAGLLPALEHLEAAQHTTKTTTGTPPISAAPGRVAASHRSAAGAVTGLLQALAAKDYATACSYALPAAQARCRQKLPSTTAGQLVDPRIENLSVPKTLTAAEHKDRAIVVMAGRFCTGAVNAQICFLNRDPDASLVQDQSFDSQYDFVAQTSGDPWSQDFATVARRINGKWYLPLIGT